jgi:hypothetical protein
MAICHDARKGRYSGSHWSKPARLRSTRPVPTAIIAPATCRSWMATPRPIAGAAPA